MKNEIYEDSYKHDKHFSFGKNWQDFLKTLTDEKIEEAKKSLVDFLGGESEIRGKTFVDIGCGSGLFSYAALKLGAARVVSVDIDEFSVACAVHLKKKDGNPENWEIKKGSALDGDFISSLGQFDIVYSWGVLHHTGDMYKAFQNVKKLIKDGGLFYLAIYNKYTVSFHGGTSNTWIIIKKIYNKSNSFFKKVLDFVYAGYILSVRVVMLQSPINYVRNYKALRGMNFYNDIKDWLGGYPYEFASVDQIVNYFGEDGILCKKVIFRDGTGCNEFLLKKD